MSADSTVIGAIVLARHGDRQGFYQDEKTYTPSLTSITPLGTKQEFQLGQLLKSLYLNESSPSNIEGLNATVDLNQVWARADAGGEGGVIYESSVALLQGMWPATGTLVNTTLANGSTITGPLNGYQYVPIESVEPANDVSLEGYTSCNTFSKWTTDFYASPAFKQKAQDNAAFFQALPQYLDGRPATLENMWNIYDFMNVNNIHNAAFNKAVPPAVMAQARDLANWHEYGVFSSPSLTGIGNIAGQTILPTILTGASRIANSTDPLKYVYAAVAYKPFLSLFNMTGVAQAYPELAGIVEYAAAVAFEVRKDASGSIGLRLNFKNGTEDSFKTYRLLGSQSDDIPLSTFMSTLAPVAINTTSQWCSACSNTADRGCAAIVKAPQMVQIASHDRFSPVGAGFLGAGLTLAVVAILAAVLIFLGLLTCGRRKRPASTRGSVGSHNGSLNEKA